MLSDDLGSRVTLEPFGAGVPAADVTASVEKIDRIIFDGVQQQLETLGLTQRRHVFEGNRLHFAHQRGLVEEPADGKAIDFCAFHPPNRKCFHLMARSVAVSVFAQPIMTVSTTPEVAMGGLGRLPRITVRNALQTQIDLYSGKSGVVSASSVCRWRYAGAWRDHDQAKIGQAGLDPV
jgi:hypothetical protein